MPGPGSVACPKPLKRSTLKAKARRHSAEHVAEVRTYVFARERNVCRCCRCRPAESLHEIRPKSLRGRVSRRNSIAVCGSGTTKCHGYLQQRRIEVVVGTEGAEGGVYFIPKDMHARNWMKLEQQHGMESLPMAFYEAAE